MLLSLSEEGLAEVRMAEEAPDSLCVVRAMNLLYSSAHHFVMCPITGV